MKNILKEYIELTDEQKENIWNNCDFIFDTNVLLNLYRYSPKMSKLIISSMNDLKDRIWIPYNIAEEFLKNRHNIISTLLYNFYKCQHCCQTNCFKAFITALDFIAFSMFRTKVA